MTRHVLRTQCKLPLKKREGIVNFIDELRAKGFICPLEELPTPDRQVVENSDIHHFYCWRSVANPLSVSTPVRVVVDPTMSGLNGCLPKGANNLCNLLELQIDFRCNVVAYSYDISKMYNSLRMKACSLPFQLFLWKDELEETNAEQIWVFVVAIYGTLTSGNQATSAI